MEPGKTSFFQALGVPTKIARGTIEITTDLKLVAAKDKVGPSEATLLNMLNISPFTYGLGVEQVYDQGQAFPPEILDIGDEQLLGALSSAIATIATISLAVNFPTLPSVMHSVVNSYKKVLAVAIETDFSWPEIEQLKDRIANPDAYAAAAPVAAAGASSAAAPAEEAKKDEEEEEEDDEGFGGLLYVKTLPIPFPTDSVSQLHLLTKERQNTNLLPATKRNHKKITPQLVLVRLPTSSVQVHDLQGILKYGYFIEVAYSPMTEIGLSHPPSTPLFPPPSPFSGHRITNAAHEWKAMPKDEKCQEVCDVRERKVNMSDNDNLERRNMIVARKVVVQVRAK